MGCIHSIHILLQVVQSIDASSIYNLCIEFHGEQRCAQNFRIHDRDISLNKCKLDIWAMTMLCAACLRQTDKILIVYSKDADI